MSLIPEHGACWTSLSNQGSSRFVWFEMTISLGASSVFEATPRDRQTGSLRRLLNHAPESLSGTQAVPESPIWLPVQHSARLQFGGEALTSPPPPPRGARSSWSCDSITPPIRELLATACEQSYVRRASAGRPLARQACWLSSVARRNSVVLRAGSVASARDECCHAASRQLLGK